jgi:predicted phage tail component-like protein
MTEHMKIMAIRGRGLTGQELTTIRVPGSDKEYVSYREKPTRYLEIDFEVRAKSKEELRKKIDELSAIIETSEEVPIIFSDESDRTYFGEYAGVEESTEYHHVGIHRGTIYILRDKYKYGPEKSLRFPADIVEVENEGTAETEPIFELTAKEKTTFAMVSNGDDEDSQYNLIGTPADDDVQVVDTRTSVLYENGKSLDTWSTATPNLLDEHFIKNIGGEMTTDDAGIRANGYGTGDKLHGPAIFKEISPIQDFEIETTFDIISRNEIDNFRLGINFLDENMNMLGTLAIKDNSRAYKRRVPLARYGPYRGASAGYLIGDSKKNDKARETTLFYLRVKREGKRFEFYIGEWQNQKHVRHWTGKYNDKNNDFQGKLKYITLFIAKWGDRPKPTRLRINSVEVFELAQATVDQTPYILYPGDVVTFDNKEADILVNGEPRMDLKNFGGSPFKLKKGKNMLIVSPMDAFETRIRFRDKYL